MKGNLKGLHLTAPDDLIDRMRQAAVRNGRMSQAAIWRLAAEVWLQRESMMNSLTLPAETETAETLQR